MFFVYVIKSLQDDKLYIGSTNNLKIRLQEHNSGKVTSTKFRKPFELVYCELYKAESDARKREQCLKLNGNALWQLKRRISKSIE